MDLEELIVFFLDEARDVMETWDEAVAELKGGFDEESFNQLFRAAHNLKGTARSLELLDFADYVHVVEDLMTDIINDHSLFSQEIVSLFDKNCSYIRDWLSQLELEATFKPGGLKEEIDGVKKIRVDLLGEEAANKTHDEEHLSSSDKGSGEGQLNFSNGQNGKTPISTKEKGKKSRTIRVDLQKIDKITRALGELTVYKEILMAGKLNDELDNNLVHSAIEEMGRIISESNEDILSLRVVPIGPLFNKIIPGGEELARDVNKKIEFVREGENIEVDKLIIEKIRDPLNHILRNSIDHGVESPEDRMMAGKDQVATVKLSSWTEGVEMVIEISDNGKGLDKARILEKAIEKGLVDSSDSLSDEEIFLLILNPGFSTAEKVTDISGRGVGMDVVNSIIKDLGGRLIIRSEKGKGSSFQIRLPSNFNILDALVFEVGGEVFACPIKDIKEVVYLKEEKIETLNDGSSLMKRENRAIELASFNRILCERNERQLDSYDVGFVTQTRDETLVFTFDKVVHGQKVFMRPLEGKMKDRKEFLGTAILSSGEPTLLLNISFLMEKYYGHKQSIAS